MAVARQIEDVSDLHISDVIDVIEQDPDYTKQSKTAEALKSSEAAASEKGDSSVPKKIGSPNMSSRSVSVDPDLELKRRAYVKITEQPASKALRFRYECEGRSAGSIPGAKSTLDVKTFPAIQVVGYRGRAVVVVSCVTKDSPYRPHPHSLVGKEGCKKGVCTMEINNENMTCTFPNLGIQCVKKKGIEEALKQREEVRVDPFHTGFAHRNQPQNIDLNAVRLCFQVFLEGAHRGKFVFPLKPVVSDPIFDKKAMCDLTICKLSDFTSPVTGAKEIIMLCDKVTKDDIQVRFYQEVDGHLEWEGFGDFAPTDVHKQVAISFRTPRYKNIDVDGPIELWVQLRRPSDNAISESRIFQYLPMDTDAESLKRKKCRLGVSNSSRMANFIQSNAFESNVHHLTGSSSGYRETGGATPRPIRQGSRTKIKKEPVDSPNTDEREPVTSSAGYNFGSFTSNNSVMQNLAPYMSRYPLNDPSMPLGGVNNPSPGFSSSVSPNPSFEQYTYLPVSQMPYNFPTMPSSTYGVASNPDKGKNPSPMTSSASFMDLIQNFNIQPQTATQQSSGLNDLNDIPSSLSFSNILSESNFKQDELQVIDNISNLSLIGVGENEEDHDVAGSSSATDNLKLSNANQSKGMDCGTRPKTMAPPPPPAAPTDSNSAMNISVSDVLDLVSAMSASDLDSAEGFATIVNTPSSLIKEIDTLNTL